MSRPTCPTLSVRYADHDDAVIDLHLPDEAADRLVVLLHGGFWKPEWDRRHTRPMARALADAGCTVATPEYRRVARRRRLAGHRRRRAGRGHAGSRICSARSGSPPGRPW